MTTDPQEQRDALVDRLVELGHLRTERAIEAMRWAPRERFLPGFLTHRAYEDNPLPIGFEQTISAPHMVAIMTEALELKPGHRVLEVGTGSGYQAAVLARIVGPRGRVVSVERITALAERARRALNGLGLENVEIVHGDGSQGYAPEAPYDRVVVTCAAPKPPPPLLAQLSPHGILLVPVGSQHSELWRIRRSEAAEDVETEVLGPCAFVPLRGTWGQGADAFAN